MSNVLLAEKDPEWLDIRDGRRGLANAGEDCAVFDVDGDIRDEN